LSFQAVNAKIPFLLDWLGRIIPFISENARPKENKISENKA
jgi:hypothetical protein